MKSYFMFVYYNNACPITNAIKIALYRVVMKKFVPYKYFMLDK